MTAVTHRRCDICLEVLVSDREGRMWSTLKKWDGCIDDVCFTCFRKIEELRVPDPRFGNLSVKR